MAASYPSPTWAVNGLITAAKLTNLSENIDDIHGAYDAWTSYTPTLTQSATVTKTVSRAKYAKFGRTVVCQGLLTVTGSGTSSNAIVVGLPVTSVAVVGNAPPLGTAVVFDTSAGLYYRCIAAHVTTTTMSFLVNGSTSANYAGASDFTAGLASGDAVSWQITYESAS